MIVDYKKISYELRGKIKKAVSSSRSNIELAIIKATYKDPSKNAGTEAFLKQKHICGEEVGINVREYDVTEFISSRDKLEKRVSEIALDHNNNAVIIQLPLPALNVKNSAVSEINTQALLDRIPTKKDADALNSESCGRYENGDSLTLTPPVILAIEEILRREAPDILQNIEKKVIAIVGQGFVIGRHINRWAIRNKALAFSGLRSGCDIKHYTLQADIVISGAGKPHLITADMIKEGAVVFDFGFSRKNNATLKSTQPIELINTLVGDVEPSVVKKASLLTPVPGGMGPLSVTMLFWNVAKLSGINPLDQT